MPGRSGTRSQALAAAGGGGRRGGTILGAGPDVWDAGKPDGKPPAGRAPL